MKAKLNQFIFLVREHMWTYVEPAKSYAGTLLAGI